MKLTEATWFYYYYFLHQNQVKHIASQVIRESIQKARYILGVNRHGLARRTKGKHSSDGKNI